MKGRNWVIVLASLVIVAGSHWAEARPDHNLAVNKNHSYLSGYDDFLRTREFAPSEGISFSDDDLANYHAGYFQAVSEYQSGWNQGYSLGGQYRQHGLNRRTNLFKEHSSQNHRGRAWDQGVNEGYGKGYDQTVYNPSTTANDSLEQEFLAQVAQNSSLQTILQKMQSVEQNNRCAEGTISILSALLGEDIRKYGDWSDLTFDSNGFPNITISDLTSMIQKSDKFVQVNPNTPAKPFRVNIIWYPTLNVGHIEIMGSDGKWYSDGLEVSGSQLNSYLPKEVTSFDVDTSKFLGYTTSNPQPIANYVAPFAGFFDTDPNSAPRSE